MKFDLITENGVWSKTIDLPEPRVHTTGTNKSYQYSEVPEMSSDSTTNSRACVNQEVWEAGYYDKEAGVCLYCRKVRIPDYDKNPNAWRFETPHVLDYECVVFDRDEMECALCVECDGRVIFEAEVD